MTTSAVREKQTLLTSWLRNHTSGNEAPLFQIRHPAFTLTPEAISLLRRPQVSAMALYIVSYSDGEQQVPIYIGKSRNPWQRWERGHLRGLRQAVETGGGLYARWCAVFDQIMQPLLLHCISEDAILAPPIPGFPQTVGSVEYQLISLTADAYPDRLLNSEGVAR
jgi:hypothetical protein